MTSRRAFVQMVTQRNGDEVLIPRLSGLMTNPALKAFAIHMPRTGPRSPDGWFHPSTHPSWGERQLYYYLQASHGQAVLRTEDLDPTGTMAIAQGHWLHAYLQHVLLDAGMVVVSNPKGRDSAEKVETPLVDQEHMSRGHMDGVLSADLKGLSGPTGLEIKSINPMSMAKIPKGPANSPEKIDWLIQTKAAYYLQAQEYMRIGGHREQRMLIVAPSYPFTMAEMAIPYDEHIAEATLAKYVSVLTHFRNGTLPPPCCAVRSPSISSCAARQVCPIGQM